MCTPTPGDACSSYIERTVWDGDQILYELRGEGGNAATTQALNTDVSSNAYDYGKVGYVHAGGIDAPLVLMDGRVPNYNWRGLPESSVWLDGTTADCTIVTTVGAPCTTIRWPGNAGVYLKQGGSASTARPTWVGSLLANGVGSTGMAYRRNRFYDGATGQFNQQDPIGLAGGANSYGFAGGDPVNFSDPLGLCPYCGPLALAGLGAAEETVPVIGQVVGTATIAVAGLWALGKAVSSLTEAVATAATSAREESAGATVRFQAQGGGLERSVVVQAGASGQITAADALHGLAQLRSSLSPAEANARAQSFDRAERFISGAAAAGGYMGPGKPFSAGGSIRVDVEVLRATRPVFVPGGRSDAIVQPGG